MTRQSAFILFIAILLCHGCGSPNIRSSLSKPNAARVSIDDILSKFDNTAIDILLRYLIGNERWEVRKGRGIYAVRKQLVDGKLTTTPDGFYRINRNDEYYQTCVVISFGVEYWVGGEHPNVTRTKPGIKDLSVVIESHDASIPGNSSCLIVQGAGINIEIYDR